MSMHNMKIPKMCIRDRFKQGNLLSPRNILGLLQQQERAQRMIDTAESQLPDLRGEIWEKNKEYNLSLIHI